MEDVSEQRDRRGRRRLVGYCTVCGTKSFQYISNITEKDLRDILQTAHARCKRAGSQICWADIILVIKERYKNPKLTEWKDKLTTYLAQLNIQIRGLRWKHAAAAA